MGEVTFAWEYVSGYHCGEFLDRRTFRAHRVYRDEAHKVQREIVTNRRGCKHYFYADGCKTAFKTEEDLRKYLEREAR